MKINTLELTNVRGFTYAKLDFQPGFNLIVGINGVGKTTVLESLRIVLSHLLPEATVSKNKKDHFDDYDIQIGKSDLILDVKFKLESKDFSIVFNIQKENIKSKYTDNIRNQTYNVEHTIKIDNYIPLNTIKEENKDYSKIDFYSFVKEYKKQRNQPLGIYFSSHRSLMTEEKPSKSQTIGGQSVAFADTLNKKREFAIRVFADWFIAQEALAEENTVLSQRIVAIKEAIYTFLPDFSELKVIKDLRDENNTFSIVKNAKTLSFQQLSDGERSILTLVLDIARRLTIANVGDENPLHGEAVILIDELDLHLHPKWQRSIVKDLERTFPKCQFIATTHSPQIIGEVKPEAITIIDRNIESEVYKPNVAFGLDSQRILEELLDAPTRNIEIQDEINKVNNDVDVEKYKEAKAKIAELRQTLGENDPELVRINSIIQFLEEDFSNEEDS